MDQADGYLRRGLPLVALMPPELQLDVALFIHGGLAILRGDSPPGLRRLDRSAQGLQVGEARPGGTLLVAAACAGRSWSRPRIGGQAVSRPSAELEASYAACRRLVRRAGSNFPGGFRLLPADQRRAMDALYAFMRHTDDLVDDTRRRRRAKALAQWRATWKTALRADVPPAFHSVKAAAPLARAWPMPSRRFHIPAEHLRDVLDGVEMDLDRPRYETFAALVGYCERVASAVGLACIHVWGFRGPRGPRHRPARPASPCN